MGSPGCGLITRAGPAADRRLATGSSRQDGITRGLDMGGRPGIAALITLVALGGAWTTPPPALATTPLTSTTPPLAPQPAAARPAAARSAATPSAGPMSGPPDVPPSSAGPSTAAPPEGDPGIPSEPGDPGASPTPFGPSLRLTESVSPDPVIAGARSVYALTVTNTGDQDANDVVVEDVLDPNTTPGSLPDGCSLDRRTVTCGGPGLTIPAGRSVTYELPISTDPALSDGTPLTNRARVTAPNAARDATELTTQAVTRADVELLKSAPPSAAQDDVITYTLTVTNHGPSQATDVTVHDRTRQAIAERPAECPGGGPTLSCPIGRLAPKESRTLTFTVTPRSSGGVVENCATVRTGDRERRTADNRSCADTVIEPAAAPSGTPRRRGRDTDERRDRHEDVRGEHPGEPAAFGAGDVPPPAHHDTRELPMTGTSVWMLGLGIAVLLSIGLLVRYFSRRDEHGPGC